VATDVGSVGAALGHGERGLLVPPASAEAAVEAIERLAADSGLRERLAENGRAYARFHTLERELDRIAEFISRCTSGRSETPERGSRPTESL
jgi:glycosyltransferase involved in cell wall biosynthesis